MQLSEIRGEIDRIVPHDMLCKSKRKADPGECTCAHGKAVEELYELFRLILKGQK